MSDVDIERAVVIIRKLDDLAIAGDFSAIDDLFLSLDYTTEPDYITICYIRCTSMYREKLAHWHQMVRDYAAHLDKVGKDKKRILTGLERYYE